VNFRRLAAFSACLSLLFSCSDPELHEAEFFVFGTSVRVSLAGVDQDSANQAFSQLQQLLQTLHRDWHAWEPGKLTRINAALAEGRASAVDDEMLELIRLSRIAENATQGRFNPAIGQLVNLWGFHTSDYPISGPAPGADEISRLVFQNPSTKDLLISDGVLTSQNPAVQLDFGGIGKGFAVDLACRLLADLGVQNAIVNAGGDLRAFGAHGNRPWKVAVQNPLGGVVGGLEIVGDESVFTSGNYERYRETADQKRFPHILDPRTGWPATSVMSATVIADAGWRADAAATAIIVAGLVGWSEIAREMELDKVLITIESGQIYATPAMLERLELNPGMKPLMLLYDP